MSYYHLNSRERVSIFYLHQMGKSYRQIAKIINRSHTTISREIKRNKRTIGCYCDQAAQKFADIRKSTPRHFRKLSYSKLKHYVVTKLKLGWSPEIISNRLKRDYRQNNLMRITHEGIYHWIYNDALAGGSYYKYLVRCHKKRKAHRKYGSLRGVIKNRIDISLRPLIVEQRKRYGDWEGDTMVGHKHQGRFVTHVERKSRYLLAGVTPGATSNEFNQTTLKLFKKIPSKYCKTLTLDNGKENAGFKEIEQKLKFKVYFAKPYSSWERGTNENTNGLIRRHFPKGTNFLKVTQQELEKVVKILNHRPRKCLNYRTPFEVFNTILGGAL